MKVIKIEKATGKRKDITKKVNPMVLKSFAKYGRDSRSGFIYIQKMYNKYFPSNEYRLVVIA